MKASNDRASALPEFLRKLVVYPAMVSAYAWTLHWAYSTLVAPKFAYLGYRYAPPSHDLVVITIAIATLLALLALPARLGRPSSIMIWILYVVTVAPTILMAPYTSYLDDGTALVLASTVAAVFAAVALAQSRDPRPLPWHLSSRTLWIAIAVFTIGTYLLLLFTQGLSVSALNLLDVYDVRAEYADEVRDVGILGYLVTTQANVVNPLIAARGITTRRWSLVLAAIFGQFVLYSTTGFKHILFAILAWLLIFLVLHRKGVSTRASTLVWGATGLMLVAAIVDTMVNANSLMTSLFSRRFILTPGVFSSVYVRFFSENPQVHLGHSILRPFVDYPYDATPPYVIGAWMAGLPDMASNANLFADGYANFGWLGVVGAGGVLLIFLRIVDRAAVGLPIFVSALVLVIPAVALSNTSVLTAMLSHGLVAAVILLAWMPRLTAPLPEAKDAVKRSSSPTGGFASNLGRDEPVPQAPTPHPPIAPAGSESRPNPTRRPRSR